MDIYGVGARGGSETQDLSGFAALGNSRRCSRHSGMQHPFIWGIRGAPPETLRCYFELCKERNKFLVPRRFHYASKYLLQAIRTEPSPKKSWLS